MPFPFDDTSRTLVWTVFGVLLLFLEAITLRFFILFFGIGAVVVAAARLLGLNNLPAEILLFAMVGALGPLILRKRLTRTKQKHLINREKHIELTQDLAPGATATIQYQGSTWTAVNGSDVILRRGEPVVIDHSDGVNLILKSEVIGKD